MKVRDRWWPPAPAPVTVPEPRSLRSSWAPLIWRACEGAVTRLRPLISQLAREHVIASARRRRRVAVLFREQRPDRGLPPIARKIGLQPPSSSPAYPMSSVISRLWHRRSYGQWVL